MLGLNNITGRHKNCSIHRLCVSSRTERIETFEQLINFGAGRPFEASKSHQRKARKISVEFNHDNQAMKNLLTPFEEFEPENYNDFESRYTGFGKEIYLKLEQELPEIFRELTLHKRLTFQTEDSYAQYLGANNSFAIQLDPLCEVIVLWNEQTHIEIGTWAENACNVAISFIKSEFMK